MLHRRLHYEDGSSNVKITPIKRRNLKVTNIEKEAWKVSDTISKTIEYLYKNELSETTRRKMVRDMLKERFLKFYEQQSGLKQQA
jgi:hypothetical protein